MAIDFMKRISPEYVLKNAIEDIKKMGFDGLKPYLTVEGHRKAENLLSLSGGIDMFTTMAFMFPGSTTQNALTVVFATRFARRKTKSGAKERKSLPSICVRIKTRRRAWKAAQAAYSSNWQTAFWIRAGLCLVVLGLPSTTQNTFVFQTSEICLYCRNQSMFKARSAIASPQSRII